MDDAKYFSPPAPESASGGYSLAAKGGGVGLISLLLGILIYILNRRGCTGRCEFEVGGDPEAPEDLTHAHTFFSTKYIDIGVQNLKFHGTLT
jgi:hypothetical protein